jgi:hypothetical protein
MRGGVFVRLQVMRRLVVAGASRRRHAPCPGPLRQLRWLALPLMQVQQRLHVLLSMLLVLGSMQAMLLLLLLLRWCCVACAAASTLAFRKGHCAGARWQRPLWPWLLHLLANTQEGQQRAAGAAALAGVLRASDGSVVRGWSCCKARDGSLDAAAV